MAPPRSPDGDQATEERVLVCLTCERPLVFGPAGWYHPDPGTCTDPRAEWPESIPEDEEEPSAS
jgi:hypothetical protein